jgi:hypothetical protein
MHAMEHNPNVRLEQRGNIYNYTLAPDQVPQLKPGECARCGKKAQDRCTACHLAYYCSSGCQKSDWSAGHKAACQEMQKAEHGDIAHMRNAFSAYLEKGLKTSDKHLLQKAFTWHYRTLIRMRQDIACSNDISTSGGIDKVKFEHGMKINELMSKGIYTEQELADLGKELMNNAIKWVEKKTQENTLVAPYGIRRYGIGAFESAQMDSAKEFIPQEQWQQKRMEVLNSYKQMFNKQ